MDDYEQIVHVLRELTPPERVELLSEVGDMYCVHCGYVQPDTTRRCQCTNDE